MTRALFSDLQLLCLFFCLFGSELDLVAHAKKQSKKINAVWTVSSLFRNLTHPFKLYFCFFLKCTLFAFKENKFLPSWLYPKNWIIWWTWEIYMITSSLTHNLENSRTLHAFLSQSSCININFNLSFGPLVLKSLLNYKSYWEA